MQLHLHPDAQVLGETAGKEAAALIRTKVASHDTANLVIGSDPGLILTLHTLAKAPGIKWEKVTVFQLSEFIGVPPNHRASNRKFLEENFLSKVQGLKKSILINGETIVSDELKRLNLAIQETHIDIAILGIGDKAQVGFNSAPADIKTESPYLMVETDDDTGKSLVEAGLFRSLNEVPRRAFTMSIHQVLRSKHIICPVSSGKKAVAIRNIQNSDYDTRLPVSALRHHPGFNLHLNMEPGSLNQV